MTVVDRCLVASGVMYQSRGGERAAGAGSSHEIGARNVRYAPVAVRIDGRAVGMAIQSERNQVADGELTSDLAADDVVVLAGLTGIDDVIVRHLFDRQLRNRRCKVDGDPVYLGKVAFCTQRPFGLSPEVMRTFFESLRGRHLERPGASITSDSGCAQFGRTIKYVDDVTFLGVATEDFRSGVIGHAILQHANQVRGIVVIDHTSNGRCL